MNLKRAFQAQNKLNKILDETKSKFDISYYTRITKTEKKSEINNISLRVLFSTVGYW